MSTRLDQATARFQAAETEFRAAAAELRAEIDGMVRVARMETATRMPREAWPELANTVLGTVAAFYGVTVEDIRRKRRSTRFVTPRQQAMTILHEVVGLTLVFTGSAVDRDHATVMHAIDAVASHCQTEPAYLSQFETVVSLCKNALHGKAA